MPLVAVPNKTLVDLQSGFTGVARSIQPAVVSITSRQRPRRNPQIVSGEAPTRQSPVAISAGSGFVIRSDGYIVTNDHVVDGADSVTVRLDDGREFAGTVRRDFYSDLAVVKIPASGLRALPLADNAPTQVGQWALAFGSPFALNDTMTVGIVSALGRAIAIPEGDARVRA
jgi:serine protease Do